jgi:hypothetical protein
MPMDASQEDQMPRLIPSHVGSCVFVIALSSMVLKMEQMVALKVKQSQHLIFKKIPVQATRKRAAYGMESRKTMRMPNCVFFDSCTLER